MMDLNTSVTLPCGVVLPGRTALAPMTNRQSRQDGVLSDEELTWLVRRARGGFAVVSTCAAYVCDEGKAWQGQLGIAHEGHLPGLTRLATALNQTGTVSVVQLHHGGKRATLAPESRLTCSDDPENFARGATIEDLEGVVRCFENSAVLAERAGMSGVEVHGANGYLFTQFLSPVENRRRDEYGGSLENRVRLLRKVVQRIRSRVSPEFAVGVRLSPVDVRRRWGLVLEDSCRVASLLVEDGVDFIHLSLADAGGVAPFEHETRPVVRVMRDALSARVPIFAAGGIWSQADAERARAAGADVLAIGTAAIREPDWPKRILSSHWSPDRPPWSPEDLAAVDVSESFVDYLRLFSGLISDGRPSRNS